MIEVTIYTLFPCKLIAIFTMTDHFTYTDNGIKEAEAYLTSLGFINLYSGNDAVHFANYQYNRFNKEIKTMAIDEIHGIKSKENE